MANVLVSVIIPCYNAEPFISAAVESCLNQTYAPVEIIVVDDGSADGSAGVLESFGGKIRVLRGPRTGPGSARNRGVLAARGEFIQFLDADDLLSPDRIATCIDAFTPDVDVVFSPITYFRDPPNPAPGPLSHLGHVRAGAKALLRARPMAWDSARAAEFVLRREIGTPGPLHRASLLRRMGAFREDIRNLEDIEFHFRLAMLGARFHRVETPLVRCRHHSSPSRLRTQPDRYLDALRALDSMLGLARTIGADPAVYAALGDHFANCGRKLLWGGHVQEGKRAMRAALTLSRAPRPTGVPLYNFVSRVVGLTRLEEWTLRLAGGPIREATASTSGLEDSQPLQ